MLENLAALVIGFAVVFVYGLIAEFVTLVKEYLQPQEERTRP